MKLPKIYLQLLRVVSIDSLNPKLILKPTYSAAYPYDYFDGIKFLINGKEPYIDNKLMPNNISLIGEAPQLFYTNEYDYDPETKIFDIKEINLLESDVWGPMMNFDDVNEEKFDNTKKYISNYTVKNNNILNKIKKEYPCPSIEDGFYIEEKNWNFLVRNILKKVNTIIIGPTGTGKTEIVQKICSILSIPCRIYDMGSMMDPLTDLLGSHRIENGNSVFDYSSFVEAVQTPGVILLDELSRAPLSTNNILFPCLDSRRTLPVEIADSKHDRVINVHPDCVFIATANIGSEYSGTNDIDIALLNRFIPLQLDYLPENIEEKILQIRSHVEKNTAKSIITFANKIRALYNSGELSKSVSIRECIACADLVADGFEIFEAFEFIIANKYMNNNYTNEYSIVKKLIISQ